MEGRQQTQTDVTGDQSRISSPYVMPRSEGRGEIRVRERWRKLEVRIITVIVLLQFATCKLEVVLCQGVKS